MFSLCYEWNADIGMWVECTECTHWDNHGMQTLGTCRMQSLEYVWNAVIGICMDCRHWDMFGMQTSGYVWNAFFRTCVECRHQDMCGMQTLLQTKNQRKRF